MMIEGRMLKPDERIIDLVEVLGESVAFQSGSIPAVENPVPGFPIRVSGREKIYDLVDVVEKKPRMAFVDAGLHDEIMKRAVEIAEKVARDIIPDVAERIIREEIEKLKKGG
jgi:hypothetical protein